MMRNRRGAIETDGPVLPALPVGVSVCESVKAVSAVALAASAVALGGMDELNIITDMCQRQPARTEYSNKYAQPSASGLACQ